MLSVLPSDNDQPYGSVRITRVPSRALQWDAGRSPALEVLVVVDDGRASTEARIVIVAPPRGGRQRRAPVSGDGESSAK